MAMMQSHKNDKLYLAQSIENAVAQQRFEGLEPSAEVISDLEQVVTGQLTVDDVLYNIGKRFQDVQVQ